MPRIDHIDGEDYWKIVVGIEAAPADPSMENIRIQDGEDDECRIDLTRSQARPLLRRLERRFSGSAH